MSSRKLLFLAVFAAGMVPCFSFGESWSQEGDHLFEPLAIYSTLKPGSFIVSNACMKATDAAYETSDDGTLSLLSLTGLWNCYDPEGTVLANTLYLGGANEANAKALGPYSIRLSGAGSALRTGVISGKYGTGRLEILDGARIDAYGAVEMANLVDTASRLATQVVVMVNAAWTNHSVNLNLGHVTTDYPGSIGYCEFYATNSSVSCTRDSSSYPYFYLYNGKYVFKNSTLYGQAQDYGCNIYAGAEVIVEDSVFENTRYRIGGQATSKFCRDSKLRMVSGSLDTSRIFLGVNDSISTGIVQQVGGTMFVGYLTASHLGAQPSWLDLEGGLFSTTYVCGGNKTKAKLPSGKGFALLTGNGGCLRCSKVDNNNALIHDFDRAEVGARGFRIDTNGLDCKVNQGFVDVEGEEGELVKAGGGELALSCPTDYSVSRTVIDAGSLRLDAAEADSALVLSTGLIATNPVVVSIAGNVSVLGLASAHFEGMTLMMDPQDQLAVADDFVFADSTVRFTSVPSIGDVSDILAVSGTVSDDSAKAFAAAVSANTFAEGGYGKVTYETKDGVTTFKLEVKRSAVVSDETKWRGPGTDWGVEDNWTDGVPTESDKATFDDATAPATVALGGAADVGALSFDAGAFTLLGSSALSLAAPGSSSITVSAGSHVLDVPIDQGAVTPVSVAADAALEFRKPVSGGGIAKTGSGRIVLSGANAFGGELSFSAGLNVISNSAALGGVAVVGLGDATLEIAAEADSAFPASATLDIEAGVSTDAVVVKNEADATVKSLNLVSGAIIKRGAGRLVLDATTGRIPAISMSAGDHKNGSVCNSGGRIDFPADGTPPKGGYGGFTVAEGEVVIKGSGGTTVYSPYAVHIGMRTKDGVVQPSLTLDDVTLDATKNTYQNVHLGVYSGGTESFVTNPVLRVLNGSTLKTVGIMLDESYTPTARYPVLAVTNSTVSATASSALYFSTIRQSSGASTVATSNAVFRADAFNISGRTYSWLSDSVLESSAGGYATFTGDRTIQGEVLFDCGTRIKVNAFAITGYLETQGGPFTFAFDDASWDIGPADLTVDTSNMALTRPKAFEVRNKGVQITIASGKTFRTAVPFTGTGTLAITGGGTLKFDAGAFAVTGTVAAVNGTVDLTDAGTVSNLVVKGAGTISGAAFDKGIVIDPLIGDDWSVGAAPLFANCTFADRVTVECGHGEGTALALPSPEVVVARYTGTAPDVSRWRVRGTGGTSVRGIFTAANGEIKMTASAVGLILIVR